MKRLVVIRTSFIATHHWPECPLENVKYLRDPHRHVFHVEVKWAVDHEDRQIEFIDAKQKVDLFITNTYKDRFLGRKSCEEIARELLKTFGAVFVSVFEDGENGSEIIEI